MKKMSGQENYMDYIPKRNNCYEYRLNDRGNVEIIIENRGLMNRLMQFLLKKPRVSYIELEEMGSFIWQEMDGRKSIYELALLEREKFGEKAEPVCVRLSAYMKVLRNCGYIVYEATAGGNKNFMKLKH